MMTGELIPGTLIFDPRGSGAVWLVLSADRASNQAVMLIVSIGMGSYTRTLNGEFILTNRDMLEGKDTTKELHERHLVVQ
jgi:hypothetical protein